MSDTRAVVKDVHTEHCCLKHGCKYGYGFGGHDNDDCTVTSGTKPQSYMCEVCSYVLDEDWDYITAINEAFDAGRRAVARVVLDATDGGPDHPWIPGAAFKFIGLYGKLTRWMDEKR